MRDPSELASAYFDDQLSDEDLVDFQKWMAADADHVRQFVRESLVHSRIRDLLQQRDMCGLAFDAIDGVVDPDRIVSLLDEEAAAERRRARDAEAAALRAAEAAARRHELEFDRASLRVAPPQSPWRWYAGAAVAASLLFVLAQWMLSDPPLAPREPLVAAASEPPVVGKVSKSLDARWQDPKLAAAVGSPLRAGSVALESGVVEIEFETGARVVIEAPAALQLVSTDRARLERGRVVVHVPEEALGFTLLSKAASFVDLGTEFGVAVSDSGEASVQVLDGEVALVRGGRKDSQPSMMMQVGAANLVSADGSRVEAIAFDRSQFIRRVPASPYELAVLKSRPLFYWRMTESGDSSVESSGRLPSRGTATFGLQLGVEGVHGEAGSAARMASAHGGIDLGTVSELNLRTDFTCEAWVRSKPISFGGKPAPPQRVLSTFDHSPAPTGFAFGVVGAPWYRLLEDGILVHFTVHGVYDCISTVSVREDEWTHLATVVDSNGEPNLFINGELVDKRYRQQHDARDGDDSPDSWIAAKNWNRPLLGTPSGGPARLGKHPAGSAKRNAIEEFQGWMSDVAVYDRALPAGEIFRHYDAVVLQPEPNER
jgi:hypothetical protein